MKNLTLEHIAGACGGTYYGTEADAHKEITAITTDSRTVTPGGMFAAICGERVDGHSFIADVFEKGALCVLCEKKPEHPAGAYIQVESTQKALMAIAEYYRRQLNVKVVGVTGSVGKTSTKEIIASVLSKKYRVLKTIGSFNNELGLPLTIFRLTEEDEVAVLEMGINHFGEMHRLSRIARPDCCVITNIGNCHLEFLGDRDGVLKAKSEIFDFIAPDGTIVLNGDDDKLAALHKVKDIAPVFFGMTQTRDVYATDIRGAGLEGVKCNIHDKEGSFEVTIPIPGAHMVQNALAATAVALALGMKNGEIKNGMEELKALSGRFRVMHANGITVVDDCYNANPASMEASLRTFSEAPQRKVAVLGDMGELGERARELHEQVGRIAGTLPVSLLVCVGTLSRHLAAAAQKENPALRIITADTLDEALAILPKQIREGDAVLVKASHFMHFEKIVDALTRQPEE